MKNKKAIIIALAVGAFAVFAHNMYLSNRIKQIIGPYEKIPVVVALIDVEKDQVIDDDMVTLEAVPKKFVQPGAVQNREEVIGRRAIVTIKKGNQILSSNIFKYKESYLSYEIPNGMRAVTISVNDITGISGLPMPGDFVDILVTYDFGKGGVVDKRTKTIFQNVQVLAVNKNIRKITSPLAPLDDDKKIKLQSLTLALPLRQCQRIVLAQEVGLINLVLRQREEAPLIEKVPEDTIYSVTGTREPLKPLEKAPYVELRGGRLSFAR